MIDRGISEEYVLWWLEAVESGDVDIERVEQTLRTARAHARYARGRSLIELYELGFTHYNRSPVLAAEWLRRALTELAEPTPVDDSLPPRNSRVWDDIFEPLWIRFRRR